MVYTNGLTEGSISVNGCEENNMVSVSTKQPKPTSNMDYGKKEKESNGSMNNLQKKSKQETKTSDNTSENKKI